MVKVYITNLHMIIKLTKDDLNANLDLQQNGFGFS